MRAFKIKQIYSREIRKLFWTVFDELERGAEIFAGETRIAHDTVHLKQKQFPFFLFGALLFDNLRSAKCR